MPKPLQIQQLEDSKAEAKGKDGRDRQSKKSVASTTPRSKPSNQFESAAARHNSDQDDDEEEEKKREEVIHSQ